MYFTNENSRMLPWLTFANPPGEWIVFAFEVDEPKESLLKKEVEFEMYPEMVFTVTHNPIKVPDSNKVIIYVTGYYRKEEKDNV